jgi:hypothetical protein
VIAKCFGPLSGHHQVILTQMYHETSFYKGSIVSIGIKIKFFLVVYTILSNLESYVVILFIRIEIGIKVKLSTSWVILCKILNIIKI